MLLSTFSGLDSQASVSAGSLVMLVASASCRLEPMSSRPRTAAATRRMVSV